MSYQHQYVDGTHIHFPMGKVVCIGRNYAEHAKELNNPVPTEPLLFIKAGSCVVPLDDGFTLVEGRGDVHYEAEIAVLIGKPLSRKPNAEEVRDAISGFALAPFVPGDAVEDLADIGIRLEINGEVRQDGNSRDMLNPILPMIQHICSHFSLQPGDVILTGTPAGVGALHPSDELVLELVGHSRFVSRAL
jgi:2-keto-4-pentenoate hydratase/2-oxohepta-3-ene-1,7-dioic acid hydratase in catechol pathway